jgi:transposase
MTMALKDKFVVLLDSEQRQALEQMTRSGAHAARALAHARILLMADVSEAGDGESDEAIAEAVGIHARTVARVRKLFATSGLEAALRRRPPTGRQYRKLDGAQEAHLIAVACSAPPAGRDRWTLKLLAARLVELEVVEAVDPSTIHRTLKKTISSRG